MKLNIDFYITERCNFLCDYCYRKPYKHDLYEPTIKNIDKMLYNLRNYNIKYFNILGGEPSISNNTLYLIDKIKQNVEYIRIITNGSKEEFFNELYKKNITNLLLDVSYHPQYNKIDSILYLKDLFKDQMRVKILLDSRYKDNLFNFLSVYNITDDDVFQTIISNKKNFFTNINLYRLIHKKFDISLEKLMKYNAVVDKTFRNKFCRNTFVIVAKDGSVSYPSCYSRVNKNYNIYGEDIYEHDDIFVDKCDKITHVCGAKCYEMQHDIL